MPALTESELKSKIKTNYPDCYLFYGEETYLTKIYVNKLMSVSVDESFADFNLHIFEADDTNLDRIYECALSIPMMAESKCVVVKEYPIDEVSEDELGPLETLLSETPGDCTLIFCYPTVQPKGKSFNAMVKLFAKYGVTVKFEKKTRQDLIRYLEGRAGKMSKQFEPYAAAYMIDAVGTDINLLNNELEKVCAYADGNINKSDVDAVCIRSLEARVFDMTKDLIAGKFDSAFRQLSALFEKRENEAMITGALISQYSDMYRTKAAREDGAQPAELSEYFSAYKNGSFRLGKAASAGSAISFEQLDECLEILNDADLALKSSSLDKKQILEQTLVKLARTGRNQ